MAGLQRCMASTPFITRLSVPGSLTNKIRAFCGEIGNSIAALARLMDGSPDRSCSRPTDASIGKGKGQYYNLRIILPILSISDPYLRTIEPSLLIISLATGIADCRWRHGRRHVKVKLCARCPYKPRDLASHYDP